MASEHLTIAEWKALERIGDIIIPGDEVLPPFSACGFYNHVDRIVGCLLENDLTQLRGFLRVMQFMPKFVIRFILKVASLDRYFPGVIGFNLRTLSTGLRGIPFALYYSFLDNTNGCGQKVKEGIDYDAAVRTRLKAKDDLPALVEDANPLK
jgi:hypothetical protein